MARKGDKLGLRYGLMVLYLLSLAAFGETPAPAAKTKHPFPVEEVQFSLSDNKTFLAGLVEEQDKDQSSYRSRMPKPFYYAKDFEKDKDAFIVGATNRVSTVENMTSLTGSTLNVLEKRAFPRHESQQDSPSSLAWIGIGNFSMRSSNQGFLKTGQTLRKVLLEDLKWARERGISHQRIAEPLLIAIKEFEKAQTEGPVRFSYKANHNYTIEGTKMPGKSFVSEGTADPRDQFRSGWIGFGTQGSFFNDELFANWEFVIREKGTEKALKGDALTPHLIYRYGFYQGGQFRMEPEAIVSFFAIPTKKSN